MTPIATLQFGVVTYDRGLPDLVWGPNRFRHAAVVARVRSADGATGLGFSWAQPGDATSFAGSAEAALRDVILGANATLPFETASAVRERAYGVSLTRAAAVVEAALYDLAGRLQGLPSYQLLGAKRGSLPCYIISAEEFGYTDQAQYVTLAQRYVAAGFGACKFHMWGDRSRDIAACTAVRAAVGPDVALMLDPAGRYSREDALSVGRAITELGFIRYEDPLSPLDRAGYRWLAPRLDIALFVNDSSRWELVECGEAARNGVVQGFRLDIGRAGIGGGLALAALAEAHGADMDISCFAPRGSLETCLHLGLATTPSRWFEHHEAMGYDEVPGVAAGFAIKDGVAYPNNRPGLGFEVDQAELDRYCRWTP